MSGGAGIRLLWCTREAVGLYPGGKGLVLAHLCAAEENGGAWMVTESRTLEECCPAPSDAATLAAFIGTALRHAGWERLPLALALPATEAETAEWELPIHLSRRELREALLWSLRAEADEAGAPLSDDAEIVCSALSETEPRRYWTARMDGYRIRGYFAAFSAEGLRLQMITVYPPDGGVFADEIEAAREPRMPWEMESAEDAIAPAIYAGLLMRAGSPEHLYWTARQPISAFLRAHAAQLIAVLAVALFLAGVGADVASYMAVRQARDRTTEELALRGSELVRMEEFSALRADVAQREQLLSAFSAESLPLPALLVHLGSMTVDGVHISGVQAEAHAIRIDGEAADYAALAVLMGTMEEDAFFSAEVTLEQAGQGERTTNVPGRIHFILHSSW
ncbi:PilN domain-containing protein [Selenomonas sp. oral taxon 138]|uniref:PilN domain-containing protein n=1 Tax=Selenomonas sp. oral taxon 138 TaxID=712532 RepID=UPI0002A3F97A|nr:PilN domain-containing protein [Selenomonas sp. oral taxon 138]EKX99390.1 fimbrial assembly protein PilN [Selenomonas sp. oral taxon 138 str. F0429]